MIITVTPDQVTRNPVNEAWHVAGFPNIWTLLNVFTDICWWELGTQLRRKCGPCFRPLLQSDQVFALITRTHLSGCLGVLWLCCFAVGYIYLVAYMYYIYTCISLKTFWANPVWTLMRRFVSLESGWSCLKETQTYVKIIKRKWTWHFPKIRKELVQIIKLEEFFQRKWANVGNNRYCNYP